MEQNEFLEKIVKKLSQIKTDDKAYTCNRYNIFDVLGVGCKEVAVCRFLADLLSPNGKHGCGILFLKQFMNTLGSEFQDYDDELLQNTSVITEYQINNDRRIDIVISSSKFFIPIEVKIYAEEQEKQCFDYYKFVKEKHGENTLVYLTRYGTFPSEYSTGGDKETIEHIRCISFADNIRDMLETCLPEIEDPLIKATVEVFLDTIKKHSNPLWKEKDKVFEELYNDKECLLAAIAFEKHLKTLKYPKVELINSFLNEMESQISKECSEYFCSKSRTKSADGYYDNFKLHPGFEYSLIQIEYNSQKYDICFRVEIEHNLYAGICIYDVSNDSHKKYTLIKGDDFSFLETYINNIQAENSFWAMWEYLPEGKKTGSESVPNFKEMNEAAINLFDENEMKLFVEKCVPVVKSFLESTVKWSEIKKDNA